MIYTIQNEFLTVRVEDLGAQLSSIQAPDGTEYLWQGDPDIWARRAPILFPFIARLRENTYYLDGQPYAISTHGFARDMVFSLADQGEDHISLQLTDTPETRKVYPFSFSLTVTYTLEGNRLKKSHRVENRSDKDMYYELGAHDGFRAPVEPGVPMSSWSIRLPGVEHVQFYGMDESCTLTPKGGCHHPGGRKAPPHPFHLWAGHHGAGPPASGRRPAGGRLGPSPGVGGVPRLRLSGAVDGG